MTDKWWNDGDFLLVQDYLVSQLTIPASESREKAEALLDFLKTNEIVVRASQEEIDAAYQQGYDDSEFNNDPDEAYDEGYLAGWNAHVKEHNSQVVGED